MAMLSLILALVDGLCWLASPSPGPCALDLHSALALAVADPDPALALALPWPCMLMLSLIQQLVLCRSDRPALAWPVLA
jgi:hypothetical protein